MKVEEVDREISASALADAVELPGLSLTAKLLVQTEARIWHRLDYRMPYDSTIRDVYNALPESSKRYDIWLIGILECQIADLFDAETWRRLLLASFESKVVFHPVWRVVYHCVSPGLRKRMSRSKNAVPLSIIHKARRFQMDAPPKG